MTDNRVTQHITYPGGQPVGNRFTAHLSKENARRLASISEFMAMCRLPVTPNGLLLFLLDAAEHEIEERMSK